jgi:hypothetical protein
VEIGPPCYDHALLFVHVPRTAGFTLKHLLEEVYGVRHTLLDLHKYDVEVIDPSRYELIEGHITFRKARRLVGARNLMTIVREPVSRVVSVARHMRRFNRAERTTVLRARAQPAEELFAALPELSNGQTKQLSFRWARSQPAPDSLPFAQYALGAIPFGVTERFSDSMVLFAERFGLRVPPFGVSNASDEHGDEDLRSDAFRALAAERNDLDRQLYEHANAVFQTRIDTYVGTLRAMTLREAPLTGFLMSDEQRVWKELPLPAHATEVSLEGSLMAGGRPIDAVVGDAGAGWVPLLGRQRSVGAARLTRSPDNLFCGVSGTVPVAATARSLTIEGYDRTAGVRARHEIRIRRRRA